MIAVELPKNLKDYSGVRVRKDKALLSLGAAEDVNLVRTGPKQLTIYVRGQFFARANCVVNLTCATLEGSGGDGDGDGDCSDGGDGSDSDGSGGDGDGSEVVIVVMVMVVMILHYWSKATSEIK